MPFSSDAQRRYMYAKHPEIAERWARESGEEPSRRRPPKKKKKTKPKGKKR